MEPKFRRFSKSLLDIKKIKSSFSERNAELFADALNNNRFYTSQPLRKHCKACDSPLQHKKDFSNHLVSYEICRNCKHLNGHHEDTIEYSNYLYKDNSGKNYSGNYRDSNYRLRCEKIYRPKVEFLLSVIDRLDGQLLSIDDFGCGGGHFVNSVRSSDPISALRGFDISSDLIDLANHNRLEDQGAVFTTVDCESSLLEELQNSTASVVSMLGVLEHLRNPNAFLEAFARHKHVDYLYLQLPLFGLSVLLEHAFKDVFPRLLSSGHTHLYSRNSLDFLIRRYDLDVLAEWHFGADSMDLKRALMIGLESDASDYALEFFEDSVFSDNLMDLIQCTIDESLAASQTHLVLSRHGKGL